MPKKNILFGSLDDKIAPKSPTCLDEMCKEVARRIEYLTKDKKKRLIVTISRKGPHLMDKIKGYLNEDIDWVTEIAVPFIDTSRYYGFILIDDSIYSGATFNRVKLTTAMSFILDGRDISAIEVISLPLAISEGNENIYSVDTDKVPTSLIDGEIVKKNLLNLTKTDVPYYADRIIDLIGASHRPLDLEVPHFYYNYTGDIEKLVLSVKDALSERFGADFPIYSTERYNRTDGHLYKHYTILLTSLFYGSDAPLNPEFAKIRICATGDTSDNPECREYAISSYCINTINSDDLQISTSIFNDEIRKNVWSILHADPRPTTDAHKNTVQNVIAGLLHDNRRTYDAYWDLLNTEYTYQVEKSNAILANYIYSYYMFILIKDEIDRVFGVCGRLKPEDIRLLYGNQKSEYVIQALERSYMDILHEGYSSVAHDTRYFLPVKYKSEFERLWYKSLGVKGNEQADIEEAMSAEFSMMHSTIELPSRRYNTDIFGRMRFGETYLTLYERYELICQHDEPEDLMLRLHQGIDSRIDTGSVVPLYVRRPGGSGIDSWVRLFRSGENDDRRRDQIIRVVLNAISVYREKDQQGRLDKTTFHFIFLYLMARLSRKYPHANVYNTFFGCPATAKYIDGVYQVHIDLHSIRDEEELRTGSPKAEWHNLYDYVVGKGFLNENYGDISVDSSIEAKALSTSNYLAIDMERDYMRCLDDISMIVANQHRGEDTPKDILREILNWYYYRCGDTEAYDKWKSFALEYLQTVKKGDIKAFDVLQEQYIDVVSRVPYERDKINAFLRANLSSDTNGGNNASDDYLIKEDIEREYTPCLTEYISSIFISYSVILILGMYHKIFKTYTIPDSLIENIQLYGRHKKVEITGQSGPQSVLAFLRSQAEMRRIKDSENEMTIVNPITEILQQV